MQTPDSQILWGSFFNAQSLKYDLHIMIWLAQWWMNVSWLSAQKLVTCKAPDPSGQMCRRLHAISPVPCFRDTRFRFAVDLYYLGTIPWNFPVNLEHCLDIALNIFVWHVSLHERSPDIYVLAGIYPHVGDWRIERAGKASNRCSIDRSSGILANTTVLSGLLRLVLPISENGTLEPLMSHIFFLDVHWDQQDKEDQDNLRMVSVQRIRVWELHKYWQEIPLPLGRLFRSLLK